MYSIYSHKTIQNMRKNHGNLPQHLILGFLCNSNPIYEFTEGKRGTIYFSSFLHIEEREPHIRMTFTFWRAVKTIHIRYVLKKVSGHHLLPSQILQKDKWEEHFDGMSVPNDIYFNLHSQELGGKMIFTFFPPFTSSSQVLWFSLFLLSNSKKSLAFL